MTCQTLKYSTLFDMSSDAVVIVEARTMKILEANRAASHLTGYSVQELLGMTTPELFGRGAPGRAYHDSFKRWLFDGKGYLHNGAILKKQGGRVDVDVTARVMEDAAGSGGTWGTGGTGGPEEAGEKVVMEVWRDISERVCLEKSLGRQIKDLERRVKDRTRELEDATLKLKQSQQKMIESAKLVSLGEMGAGIAHELNSPLAGILGLVEVLLGRMDRDDRNYGLLEKIKDAAVRSKYIILDMLSYARPFRDEREAVNMNEVIKSTLSLFVSEINTTSIEIEMDLSPSLPDVEGMRGQLMEVVFNIVKNARDALKGYGGIRISSRLQREGDGPPVVVVEISDTGPGVPAEIMERIFDPFFSSKDKGRGMNVGLGLSISRSIVLEHGGRIEVENLPGGGACFRVCLPASCNGGQARGDGPA